MDIRGDQTGYFITISDIVADPVHAIGMFVKSVFVYGDTYFKTALGGSLGWFQPEPSDSVGLCDCRCVRACSVFASG